MWSSPSQLLGNAMSILSGNWKAGVILLLYGALAFGFLLIDHAAAQTKPLDALVQAYPDVIARHDDKNIYWRDGTVMPVGELSPDKTFQQRLANASILDQFYYRYPAGRSAKTPSVDFDPGRFRNEAFFRKLYGDCRRGGVTKHLRSVPWFPKGRAIKFTDLHGASDQLAKVAAEIDKLPPDIKRAAYPIAGTYSCRLVLDTGKTSMHAYGAAIDLNLAFSDYWIWQSKGGKQKIHFKNRMPLEIVDIFERHGFIWGGRWYHFDTMHFEYRPELLLSREQ